MLNVNRMSELIRLNYWVGNLDSSGSIDLRLTKKTLKKSTPKIRHYKDPKSGKWNAQKVTGTVDFWKLVQFYFRDKNVAELCRKQLGIIQPVRSYRSKGAKHYGYVIQVRDTRGIIDVLEMLLPLLRSKEVIAQAELLKKFCKYQIWKENHPIPSVTRFGKGKLITNYHTRRDVIFCLQFMKIPKRKKTGRSVPKRLKIINGIIYTV